MEKDKTRADIPQNSGSYKIKTNLGNYADIYFSAPRGHILKKVKIPIV